MLDLCLACCSAPLPSEKLNKSHAHRTPCCGKPICEPCLRRRPRLARYCISCQTGSDVLAKASTSVDPISFTIGEAELDEQDMHDAFIEPPPYSSKSESAFWGKQEDKGGQVEKEIRPSTGTPPREAIYYIAQDDTLVGIALRHGVDPRSLAELNHFPPEVLTKQPALISTRQFILLPTSAKPSTSPQPLWDPESERQRLLLRRFQVASKCADVDVARVYLDAVLESRRQEQLMALDQQQREKIRGEVSLRIGGEVEEALVKFEDDQRWEAQEIRAGRRQVQSKRKF